MLIDVESMLAYFDGKFRVEANINTKEQIRQLFQTKSTDLLDVLNSDANPLLAIFDKYKANFLEIVNLSIPLIVGNLGQILIGATDVFVAAKYNIHSLAAVSIPIINIEKIIAYSFTVVYVIKLVTSIIPSLFFLQILNIYTYLSKILFLLI
jgi:Na+-driven multidrug efflux pump